MATPRKTPSTRATRSREETKSLASDLIDEGADSKIETENEKKMRLASEDALRKKLESFNVSSLQEAINSVREKITGSINDVGEWIQAIVFEIDQLKQCKKLLEADIKNLHGAEILSSAIEDLVAEYERKSRTLEEEHQKETQRLETVEAEADVEVAKRIDQMRKNAEELEKEVELARLKKEEEWRYSFGLRCKRAEDEFAENMRKTKLLQDETEALKIKNWLERESDLKKKEQEFDSFKAQVEALPQTIKSEVSKAEAILSSVLKKNHEHEIAILKNEQQAKESVLNANVANLAEKLLERDKLIETLQSRITAAEQKVAEIAKDALNAASGRQALTEVQTILQNQGNGTGNSRART